MKWCRFWIVLVVWMVMGSVCRADSVTLDFEGLCSTQVDPPDIVFQEHILDFYNGGTSTALRTGTNYGIRVSPNGLAIIDAGAPCADNPCCADNSCVIGNDGCDTATGWGNFENEPSPSNTLFFLTGSSVAFIVDAGFTTSVSVYYVADSFAGSLSVYDNWSGDSCAGTLLATKVLPTTGGSPPVFDPFVQETLSFSGTGKCVDLGGTADQIAFDDLHFPEITVITETGDWGWAHRP